MLERLEALTPEAEEACRVVAAASEPTVALVEAAAGPAGLEDALQARVLELDGERVRFTHPLLASGVAARTVGERKRTLHERLAAQTSDVEERARHLALAASGPSAEVAEALDAAARQARARGSAASAAELVEQALLLTPPGTTARGCRARLEAADLHFEAGDVRRSLALLEEAAGDEPPGHGRAAVLLRLGLVFAETSGADAAVAGLARGARRKRAGTTTLEARIRLNLGEAVRFTEGTDEALDQLRAAVELAARVGDDALSCEALAVYALVQLNSGRGVDRERMERALELEAGLGGRAAATPHIVHLLVWTGDVERARKHIERWARWARSHDHPSQRDADWYLALLECRHGSWEAAAQAAESAVAVEEQFGRGDDDGRLVAVGRRRRPPRRGRPGSRTRGRALAAVGRPRVAESSYAWVLGFLELSLGDARGALKHLDPAGRGDPRSGHSRARNAGPMADLSTRSSPSASSLAPRNSSFRSLAARATSTGRGRWRSRRATRRSCTRHRAIWTVPSPPSRRRSRPTTASLTRSSTRGHCWHWARRSGGRSSAGGAARRWTGARRLRRAAGSALGREGESRARAHRRPHGLPRRADRGRAPHRRARRRGSQQPRGRRFALPHRAQRRDGPVARLPEARRPLAHRARRPPRARDRGAARLKQLRFPAFAEPLPAAGSRATSTSRKGGREMRKYLLVLAVLGALIAPAALARRRDHAVEPERVHRDLHGGRTAAAGVRPAHGDGARRGLRRGERDRRWP